MKKLEHLRRFSALATLLVTLMMITGVSQGGKEVESAVVSIWVGDTTRIVDSTIVTGCIATGFLVSSDGYLLTNKHVYDVAMNKAQTEEVEVKVRLSDGTLYPVRREKTLPAGSFEWLSAEQDMALLKIQAPVHDLPYLMLGNSDRVNAGDRAQVIGFPDPADRGCASPMLTEGRVGNPRYTADPSDLTAACVTVALAGIEITVFVDNTIELAAGEGPGDPLAAPGNSGSPILLCDEVECRAAGILAAGRRGESATGVWQIYGYAAPINVAIDNLIPKEVLPDYPPEIVEVYRPSEIETGQSYVIEISFRDLNGDLAKAKLVAVEPEELPGFPKEIDLGEEERTKGEIAFRVSFEPEEFAESQEVQLKVILRDKRFERVERTFPLRVIKAIRPSRDLQSAIDSAKDDDVILIPAGGLYLENLIISDKKITLEGEEGGAYIGAANDRPAIHIEDAEVTLKNLTIIDSRDIGILIEDAKVEIENIAVKGTGTEYSDSVGILVKGYGLAEIKNCSVSNNKGDGIRAEEGARLSIIDSTISSNGESGIEGSGGGIHMTVIKSTVSDNKGHGIAGGWSGSVLVVENNTATNNRDCGIVAETEVRGRGNRLIGNPICGTVPPEVRIPLALETGRTEITVPGDYSIIQEAIDALREGGTITIAPGTYQENVSIYKSLTLRGEDRNRVILNGEERLTVSVSSNAKEVILEGLTIQNGMSGTYIFTGLGDTIVSINDVTITKNRDCGIVADATEPYARGPDDDPLVSVTQSEVSHSKWGDGIELAWYATAEIKNNNIIGNGRWGIAVHAQECTERELPSYVEFHGWVRGEGNEMRGNGKGDICPHPALPQTLDEE